MSNNKLMFAGAGTGKTTFITKNALLQEDNVLLTTYTEANAAEIKQKILQAIGYIPSNITIQTWFSFLLQHGVRPYQSALNDALHESKIGFHLSTGSSTKYTTSNGRSFSYSKTEDFYKYYFVGKGKLDICSDTIADFVVSTNTVMKGEVIRRVGRIYKTIYIDEVQDLAGWELEIIKLLLASNSNVILTGDPRQVTYQTHHSTKHKKYRHGKLLDYIQSECSKLNVEIDTHTLSLSHRNCGAICDFAYRLYPMLTKTNPCSCVSCQKRNNHQGIYIVRSKDVQSYLELYQPKVLKWSQAELPDLTFGNSKGLTFGRVLIYPTKTGKTSMVSWLKDQTTSLGCETRSKLYVAITRARLSVAIICDETITIEGVQTYVPVTTHSSKLKHTTGIHVPNR